jgi:Tripartite tricarboxylate transporter family receptor
LLVQPIAENAPRWPDMNLAAEYEFEAPCGSCVAYQYRRVAAMTVLVEPFASVYDDRSRRSVIVAPGVTRTAVISTSSEVVDQLNKQIKESLSDPKIQARLLDLGGTPMPMMPADFGKFIADEIEKWAKVIRAANIKPES